MIKMDSLRSRTRTPVGSSRTTERSASIHNHEDIEAAAGFNKRLSSDFGSEGQNLLSGSPQTRMPTYGQKVASCDRKLDELGMGMYQWCIFGLCGCGYFLDLLYAQAFGMIEPAIQQEFGFSGI